MEFDVVLADPPWRYGFSRSKTRAIENHYPTMDVDDICALNVPSKRNSVLYLWATAPKLPEAMRVMDSWGFKYKSQMIWDKERIGMGYWARGVHEIVLIGTRGKFSPPAPCHRLPSVVREKRGAHSKKPGFLHLHIEEAFPDAEKLEMFARSERPGWSVWGNEVEGLVKINEREEE